MPILSSNLRVDGSQLVLTANIAWRNTTETSLGWLLRVDMMEEDTRTDDFLYQVSLPITPSGGGAMTETRAWLFPINSNLGTEIGNEEIYAVLTMTPRDVGGELTATDTTNVVSVDA